MQFTCNTRAVECLVQEKEKRKKFATNGILHFVFMLSKSSESYKVRIYADEKTDSCERGLALRVKEEKI